MALAAQAVADIELPDSQPTVDSAEIEAAARRLETAAPEDILRWTVERFGPDVAVSCSFGGPSGIVLVDMLARLALLDQVDVYVVDTGLLFDETHALRAEVERRYGFTATVFAPALNLDAASGGLRRRAVDARPQRLLRHAPRGAQSGGSQRAARLDCRAAARSVAHPCEHPGGGLERPSRSGQSGAAGELDRSHGLGLRAPIRHARQRLARPGLPQPRLHRLHQSPARDGEDLRAGRWRGSDKTECGLHWQI